MPGPIADGVTDVAATAAHFARRLSLETDCADVAATLRDDPDAIIVVDSRSREAFDAGHVPGAHSLPHAEVTPGALDALDPTGTRLFVTYCWGPHCNGATRGALAIAREGRAVKEMLGGVWGWEQEGFALTTTPATVNASTQEVRA